MTEGKLQTRAVSVEIKENKERTNSGIPFLFCRLFKWLNFLTQRFSQELPWRSPVKVGSPSSECKILL